MGAHMCVSVSSRPGLTVYFTPLPNMSQYQGAHRYNACMIYGHLASETHPQAGPVAALSVAGASLHSHAQLQSAPMGLGAESAAAAGHSPGCPNLCWAACRSLESPAVIQDPRAGLASAAMLCEAVSIVIIHRIHCRQRRVFTGHKPYSWLLSSMGHQQPVQHPAVKYAIRYPKTAIPEHSSCAPELT